MHASVSHVIAAAEQIIPRGSRLIWFAFLRRKIIRTKGTRKVKHIYGIMSLATRGPLLRSFLNTIAVSISNLSKETLNASLEICGGKLKIALGAAKGKNV